MRFPDKSEMSQQDRPVRFGFTESYIRAAHSEQHEKPWSPPVVDVPPKRFPWGLAFSVVVIMAVGTLAWWLRQ